MPYLVSDDDDDAEPFVETDPTGRYGRYSDLIGAGSVKKVYRAFDIGKGEEVAWNQVSLRKFVDDNSMIARLFTEVRLLTSFKNDNIIACFAAWNDNQNRTLNFITEVCMSGNLREYRKKHRRVSVCAIKNWVRQILRGLEYLHTRKPCVIHRDLNCSNIFIDGHTGKVKIGDLGLATARDRNAIVQSMVGTPEYMAPEIFEEKYTETVDIYSFGLCVLELVTMEIPYSECRSIVEIYRKVSGGVKPQALNKVKDPEVKGFIEKCIVRDPGRPSAAQLLKDPIFDGLPDDNDDDDGHGELFGVHLSF
ncbi:probable serine/threonine-protein kinase WNK11 [Humulus lupulus]|uniref:probable serine/threonine-protein kinase WNK11 n=1 Tax=Humulus lupulus TaxID=3486 RepID=UPI002B40A408|nr:probable serine/threonine-protein kinase WNK11 [Humulus lupulus]